jgi:hypothetical protein
MSMTSAPASEPEPRPSDFVRYAGRVWRVVEAQHRISTNRLADSAADQAMLEQLAEAVKPTIPPTARGLHYLLATPFRYGFAKASRFRRAGERPGIFYAAEAAATAVAETAYWRLFFVSRSPGMRLPRGTIEHSGYTVRLAVDHAIDLTRPPLAAARSRWVDPDDYGSCQALAARARAMGAQLIRYESVRDPAHRANLALLDPAGFADIAPKIAATYHFRFEGTGLSILAAFPSTERYRFEFADFGLSKPG